MDLSAIRGNELEELEFAESLFINHGNNPINIEQRLERTYIFIFQSLFVT